ncbi:hypothetical protein MCOR05_007451 [Pyricularia oryzae]|nr:hypothetical protein MCOR05_007451 [Pyricularia oryzae]
MFPDSGPGAGKRLGDIRQAFIEGSGESFRLFNVVCELHLRGPQHRRPRGVAENGCDDTGSEAPAPDARQEQAGPAKGFAVLKRRDLPEPRMPWRRGRAVHGLGWAFFRELCVVT